MAVITLTGPTCAGKSTVERELQALGCGRAISHTTRPQRFGESNGIHYHFVSAAEYDSLKRDGAFIETIEFGQARYAMSAQALRRAQDLAEHVAIVVEPVGAAQIWAFCRNNGLTAVPVWIDCKPKLQAERWMERAVQELDRRGLKSDLVPHVERLALMLTEEVKWRQGAQAPDRPYRFMLDSSSASPRELAQTILRYL